MEKKDDEMKTRNNECPPGFWIRYRACMEAVGITFIVFGTVYATILEPHFNKMIDVRQTELKESVEYTKCQLRAIMTDEQIEKAKLYYDESKSSRGINP
jgi:hypothetical protein